MTPRIMFSAASLAALAVLGGCQMLDSRPARVAVQPAGIVGEWATSDGIAISQFSPNGNFVLLAADTGNNLSEGTYRYIDAQTIELKGYSLIQRKPTVNNCLLVSPSQLNCTSSEGQQSVLIRRTGVS